VDLPTYTNIWRIEKRLYKLYDLRLPMPLPLVQIGVFLGVFVPWIVLLKVIGIPFRGGWILPLYIVPPGILTWMATRPVIEGKRLTELLLSQSRYLVEPRTWCRLTPIREPREVVVVVKVWRRPGDAASSVAAAVRAGRKAEAVSGRRGVPVRVTTRVAVTPGVGRRPAYPAAPQPLLPQLAALDASSAAPVTSVPARHPEPQTPAPAVRAAEREPAPVPSRGQTTHRWPPPEPRGLTPEPGAESARTGQAPMPAAQMERPPVTPVLEQSFAMPAPPARPGPLGDPAPGPQVRERATSSPAQPAAPNPAAPDLVEPGPVAGQEPTLRGEPQPTLPEAPAEPPEPTPDPAESPRGSPVPKAPTTRPDIPQVSPATRPDIPMVPGAFGAAGRDLAPARPADESPGEQPAVEQPAVEQPAVEQPAVEQPAVEQPAATRPSAEQGVVEEPVASSPPPEQPPLEQGTPGQETQTQSAASEPQSAGSDSPDPAQDGPPPWSKSMARPMREGQADALIWPPPGHKRRTRSPKHRRTDMQPPAVSVPRSPQAVPPVTPATAADPPARTPAPANPAAEIPAAEIPAAAEPAAPNPAAEIPAAAASAAAKPPTASPQTPPSVRPGPVGRPLPPVQPAASQQAPGQSTAPPAKDRRTWPAGPPVHGVPPRPQGAPVKPPPPRVTEVPRPDPRPQQAAPPRAVPPVEVPPSAQPVGWEPTTRSGPASPVRPRPRPLVPPAPPPAPAAAITPPDVEQESTVGGLRRLFQAVGGGHSDVDAQYEERLQQPFQGTRHIVVLGCTGGAGQTVTSLMLGHSFAQYCGEPIVAIDVNPGPGALARRTRSETPETLTGLITRADQVHSLTAMRRYTSQAKSGLEVIAAGKNPLPALDDRDYALAIRTLDRFYSVTLLDAAAAVVARVLPHADQIVLVAPASTDAPRAVGMTFEWLDGHGYDGLRSRAVTVINGVSRRSMDDVEQAEAVARGQCRALVRIPWDDHLSLDRSPRNELKALRAPTRRAYLALAGVVAGGFTTLPERYQEHEQEVGR
jgi:MinD-like ATPase involved in chromosome partitioning or flagellar assembly